MFRGDRSIPTVLCTLLLILSAASAFAFQGNHDAMELVWNAGSFDCAAVPMTLVADNLWEAVAPVPESAVYYFQFWPDGALDPKYGADPLNPGHLLLDEDPSQAVAEIPNGYAVFRLDDAARTYTITGAEGSILLAVTFNDGPAVPPAATAAVTRDGDDLGLFNLREDGTILMDRLLPGATYQVVVAAPGYQQEILSLELPVSGSLETGVTLDSFVAAETMSLSGIKALYR